MERGNKGTAEEGTARQGGKEKYGQAEARGADRRRR